MKQKHKQETGEYPPFQNVRLLMGFGQLIFTINCLIARLREVQPPTICRPDSDLRNVEFGGLPSASHPRANESPRAVTATTSMKSHFKKWVRKQTKLPKMSQRSALEGYTQKAA